jgi:hypothetical protein
LGVAVGIVGDRRLRSTRAARMYVVESKSREKKWARAVGRPESPDILVITVGSVFQTKKKNQKSLQRSVVPLVSKAAHSLYNLLVEHLLSPLAPQVAPSYKNPRRNLLTGQPSHKRPIFRRPIVANEPSTVESDLASFVFTFYFLSTLRISHQPESPRIS